MATTNKLPRPLNEFSKPTLDQLCREINLFLQPFAAAYGISLKVGGGDFDAATFCVKLRREIQSGKTERQQAHWNSLCAAYHLSPDDLNRTFDSRGATYRVTGTNLNSAKYPIACERVRDHKGFSFPINVVRLALHPDQAEIIRAEESSQVRVEWGNLCFIYGFQPDDLGRSFQCRGQTYILAGIESTAKRNPILCRLDGTERRYKFAPEDVKRMLGQSVPAGPVVD